MTNKYLYWHPVEISQTKISECTESATLIITVKYTNRSSWTLALAGEESSIEVKAFGEVERYVREEIIGDGKAVTLEILTSLSGKD